MADSHYDTYTNIQQHHHRDRKTYAPAKHSRDQSYYDRRRDFANTLEEQARISEQRKEEQRLYEEEKRKAEDQKEEERKKRMNEGP